MMRNENPAPTNQPTNRLTSQLASKSTKFTNVVDLILTLKWTCYSILVVAHDSQPGTVARYAEGNWIQTPYPYPCQGPLPLSCCIPDRRSQTLDVSSNLTFPV